MEIILCAGGYCSLFAVHEEWVKRGCQQRQQVAKSCIGVVESPSCARQGSCHAQVWMGTKYAFVSSRLTGRHHTFRTQSKQSSPGARGTLIAGSLARNPTLHTNVDTATGVPVLTGAALEEHNSL